MAGDNSTTEPPMRQEIVKLVGEHPLTRKKMKKKCRNVGALNFGGAMEQLVRGYSSMVELSTADRLDSGSNPDVPCLLGIGVPCK